MADQPRGLVPQFVREEEGVVDVLGQILIELKKMNTQLTIITDNIIREEDIILDKEEIP